MTTAAKSTTGTRTTATVTSIAGESTSTKDESKGQAKKQRSIPEEIFERAVRYFDGPVNARAERIMKSRLVLAPLGLSLTIGSRTVLAVRARSLRPLLRPID